MAEEKPAIANKKLLMVALGLAALAVVFYNFQIARIRKESRGDTVELVRYRFDMDAEDRLERKDVQVVEVETQVAEGLGNYIKSDDLDFAIGRELNQAVRQGSWLLYGHVTATEDTSPSARIGLGMVKHSFPINSELSPVEKLQPGDRVNILGMFQIANQSLQAYRIIENVKIMEKPSNRKITVEVAPEVAKQLVNIGSHAVGSLWVEVRNPTAISGDSEIAEPFRDLKAAQPERRSRR